MASKSTPTVSSQKIQNVRTGKTLEEVPQQPPRGIIPEGFLKTPLLWLYDFGVSLNYKTFRLMLDKW